MTRLQTDEPWQRPGALQLGFTADLLLRNTCFGAGVLEEAQGLGKCDGEWATTAETVIHSHKFSLLYQILLS